MKWSVFVVLFLLFSRHWFKFSYFLYRIFQYFWFMKTYASFWVIKFKALVCCFDRSWALVAATIEVSWYIPDWLKLWVNCELKLYWLLSFLVISCKKTGPQYFLEIGDLLSFILYSYLIKLLVYIIQRWFFKISQFFWLFSISLKI